MSISIPKQLFASVSTARREENNKRVLFVVYISAQLVDNKSKINTSNRSEQFSSLPLLLQRYFFSETSTAFISSGQLSNFPSSSSGLLRDQAVIMSTHLKLKASRLQNTHSCFARTKIKLGFFQSTEIVNFLNG